MSRHESTPESCLLACMLFVSLNAMFLPVLFFCLPDFQSLFLYIPCIYSQITLTKKQSCLYLSHSALSFCFSMVFM